MVDEIAAQKTKELAKALGDKAENLYLSKQLLCAEAVVCALNQGLGGGVPEDVAIRMASALPIGIGNSGCTCGALSGAVLAVGLFLGRDTPGASDSMGALASAHVLHSQFKTVFGSSCCRVLSKNVKDNPRVHFKHCAKLTAQAAELAALIILEKRPELMASIDKDYVETKETWLGAKLRRLVGLKAG